MAMQVGEFGEERLIAAFTEIYRARAGVITGIGDDGAIIATPSQAQVVSTDMATEGVHFNRHWSSAGDIGAKIAIANLADIFAMGGKPEFLIVAISTPRDEELSFLLDIARGIESVAGEFGISVVGGDLVAGSSLTISITALGSVLQPVLRSGARVGQRVFLTRGTGKSLAGLLMLSKNLGSQSSEAIRFFQRPSFYPGDLLELGLENISALMDVSDGLISDLPKIAGASGVGINLTIDETHLSYLGALSDEVGLSTLELFLRSGEEHSFILTVDSAILSKIPHKWLMIGEVISGEGLTYHGDSLPFQSTSWHW